jgi:hypothetical protein
MTDPALQLVSTCLSLRHKTMYIDVRHATPGTAEAECDSRVYWCSHTQECRGPDGETVGPCECSASRPCYTPR